MTLLMTKVEGLRQLTHKKGKFVTFFSALIRSLKSMLSAGRKQRFGATPNRKTTLSLSPQITFFTPFLPPFPQE